jgi:hypothetical protein
MKKNPWKQMEEGLRHYGAMQPHVFDETIRYVKDGIPYDDVLTSATEELGKEELIRRIEELRKEVVAE